MPLRNRAAASRVPVAATVFTALCLLSSGWGHSPSLTAAERIDDDVIARIKVEGFQDSQVMETLSWLTSRSALVEPCLWSSWLRGRSILAWPL